MGCETCDEPQPADDSDYYNEIEDHWNQEDSRSDNYSGNSDFQSGSAHHDASEFNAYVHNSQPSSRNRVSQPSLNHNLNNYRTNNHHGSRNNNHHGRNQWNSHGSYNYNDGQHY